MVVFVDRLQQMLGGQVGQAKELQAQTLQALDTAVKAFGSMAAQIGTAGESATSAMTGQLSKALDDMVSRQSHINETMRAFVDELRSSMSVTQQETSAGVVTLLDALGTQVEGALESLRTGAQAMTEVQGKHVERFSEQARVRLRDWR